MIASRSFTSTNSSTMSNNSLMTLCDLANHYAPVVIPALSTPLTGLRSSTSSPENLTPRDASSLDQSSSATPTQSPLSRVSSPQSHAGSVAHSPPGDAVAQESDSDSASVQLAPVKNAQAKAARQLLSIKLPGGKVRIQIINSIVDRGLFFFFRFFFKIFFLVQKRGRKPIDKTNFKCQRCGTTNTPEWRRGPSGRNTLCNACTLSRLNLIRVKRLN